MRIENHDGHELDVGIDSTQVCVYCFDCDEIVVIVQNYGFKKPIVHLSFPKTATMHEGIKLKHTTKQILVREEK